jgi:hypothetical protein
MLTIYKITEIFCIADVFRKNFAIEMANQPKLPAADGKRHRNRLTKCQAAILPQS